MLIIKKKEVSDFEYLNTTNIGLVNDFEKDKRFNITDLNFDVPKITKWRFKAEKIKIKSNTLTSDKIIFTNDAYNKPQFLFISKKFSGFFENDKLKLISRNSWINLDNKIKFPIGRRSIVDREPISRWGFGSDQDKDGIYISRSFDAIKFSDNYNLKIQPYLLLQRWSKDSTNAFRSKGSSILSPKVKSEISASDIFALEVELNGKINGWDLKALSSLNSLNLNRLSESNRSKISLLRRIDLTPNDPKNDTFNTDKMLFENSLDLLFSSSYREKVYKGYDGESEIYFGNLFSIANRKEWSKNDVKTNLSIISDFGEYKSKSKKHNELKTYFRNAYSMNFDYQFPLYRWFEDENIDKNYKYTPTVIKQGIDWNSSIKAAIFLYSNDTNQSIFSISSGPSITFGGLKKDFLNYTNFKVIGSYFIKGGESPFEFDDINDTPRIQLKLEQQIYGALILNYNGYLNVDSQDEKYGQLEEETYGLDIKRRAYSIGAYYKPSNEELGIQFKIFNFGYSGIPDKF